MAVEIAPHFVVNHFTLANVYITMVAASLSASGLKVFTHREQGNDTMTPATLCVALEKHQGHVEVEVRGMRDFVLLRNSIHLKSFSIGQRFSSKKIIVSFSLSACDQF